MKEEKRLFPAQEKSELVLDIIRKHWFSYVPFWFLTVVMLTPLLIGTFFWFGNAAVITPVWNNILILFISMYLLFIQGLLIFGFVDFYLDVYIITDRRIVDIAQDGLFKRTISELNLRQIQDVNATVVGVAATLLHFGDVKIQTAGDKPNFIFQSIPHPYEISKRILDLHEAYLRRAEKADKGKIFGQVVKAKQIGQNKKEVKDKKNDQENSTTESLNKTLTEKWFDEKSESCYSDETCRQKLLEGINRHLKENGSVSKTGSEDKEGELKEGKEMAL